MPTTDPKSDPTSSEFAGPCPRCGGGVPNDVQRGVYPGALSRYDNATYICSSCGTAEALWQYAHQGDGKTLPGPTEFLG